MGLSVWLLGNEEHGRPGNQVEEDDGVADRWSVAAHQLRARVQGSPEMSLLDDLGMVVVSGRPARGPPGGQPLANRQVASPTSAADHQDESPHLFPRPWTRNLRGTSSEW